MTRWALSYLRGPLSRDQLRALAEDKDPKDTKDAKDAKERASDRGPTGVQPGSDRGQAPLTSRSSTQPVLPPNVTQYFIPATGTAPQYRAVVLGIAKVTFGDAKLKVNVSRDVIAAAPIGDGAVAVDWVEAEILTIAPDDLQTAPAEEATFGDLPKAASSAKSYTAWQKAFGTWLAGAQKLELLRHAALKLTSDADEPERDFRIRVQNAQREARDKEVDAVRRKFAEKRARLETALRRAEQGVQREADQASQAKMQTAVSFGATVLGALLGRKTLSSSTLGRATTAARGVGRAYKESEDIGRAQQNVDAARKALEDLDAEIAEQTAGIAARYDAEAGNIETVSLSPKRGQILIHVVALGWHPDGP